MGASVVENNIDNNKEGEVTSFILNIAAMVAPITIGIVFFIFLPKHPNPIIVKIPHIVAPFKSPPIRITKQVAKIPNTPILIYVVSLNKI